MILHKRLDYTVPDETEDGQTVLYHDIDGEIMCADCCNHLKIVPFDAFSVDEDEEWDCAYCDKHNPATEASFNYHTTSDHDRFYLTVRCDVCKEDVYVWTDEEAMDFINDFLPTNPKKWEQGIWEFLNDNDLLHYH